MKRTLNTRSKFKKNLYLNATSKCLDLFIGRDENCIRKNRIFNNLPNDKILVRIKKSFSRTGSNTLTY